MAHRILACVSIFLFATATFAQTEPSSQPASQPATQASSISPKAQTLLDSMAKAYADSKSLTLAGQISLDFGAWHSWSFTMNSW